LHVVKLHLNQVKILLFLLELHLNRSLLLSLLQKLLFCLF
jgi:hypothetical protein